MGFSHIEEIKANGASLGTLGSYPVPHRLLGVGRHECFELSLGALVLKVGFTGFPEDVGKVRPRI
jgi:hypothetical protein